MKGFIIFTMSDEKSRQDIDHEKKPTYYDLQKLDEMLLKRHGIFNLDENQPQLKRGKYTGAAYALFEVDLGTGESKSVVTFDPQHKFSGDLPGSIKKAVEEIEKMNELRGKTIVELRDLVPINNLPSKETSDGEEEQKDWLGFKVKVRKKVEKVGTRKNPQVLVHQHCILEFEGSEIDLRNSGQWEKVPTKVLADLVKKIDDFYTED